MKLLIGNLSCCFCIFRNLRDAFFSSFVFSRKTLKIARNLRGSYANVYGYRFLIYLLLFSKSFQEISALINVLKASDIPQNLLFFF